MGPALHALRMLGNRAIGAAIQQKLAVGPVDDPYEREADRVADAVMQMPDPAMAPATKDQMPSNTIQRMCSRCQRRHRQGKPLNCEECEEELQRKESSKEPPVVDMEMQRQIQSLRGRGRSLPGSERRFFESRFGTSFSGVRIHAGPRAQEAAGALGARAFTVGRDVVFGSGQYRPGTSAGRHLLAHELTHVVQQSRGGERVQFDREQGEHGGTDDGAAEAAARHVFGRLYDIAFATYWYGLSPVERYAVIQDELEVFERIDPLTRLRVFMGWCFEVRGDQEIGGDRVDNCLRCETTKGFLGREEEKCYYPFDRAAGFFFRDEDELREAEDKVREQWERQRRRSGIPQEEFARRGRQLKAELNLGAIQNAILGTTKVVGTAVSAATAVQDAYNCVHRGDEESCVKAGQSFLSNFSKGMLER